jgi:2-hydroxychromene-2-carboxylate isomerase
MSQIEFFFDCGSPWTYLAFEGIGPIAEEFDAELIFRPILVGGIFNAINGSVYESRANPVPQKWAYHRKDLADWARYRGLSIGWPKVFPVNSVHAMRGCIVAEDLDPHGLAPFARRVFEAYWRDLEDISQSEVLEKVVADVGLDPKVFLERIAAPETKSALRANTEEVMDRGGFGSPTLIVDGDDLYFGQDRLELIRATLMERRP